jgi:membrane protein implicated in regulation of membrane protease activity
MNGEVAMIFPDSWLWLVFIVVGLLLILVELLIGVDTGLELVFIGSAFVIGGLITWPSYSWILTAVVTGAICLAYVFLGRRYVHRWKAVRSEKTNIDAIIGRHGIVLRIISRNVDGMVKIGYEEWRAKAEEEIGEGDEVVVVGIAGATLIVKKSEGGNSNLTLVQSLLSPYW